MNTIEYKITFPYRNDDLLPMCEVIHPNEAGVHPIAIQTLQKIAKELVRTAGRNSNRPVLATIILSKEKGISISSTTDQRIHDVVDQIESNSFELSNSCCGVIYQMFQSMFWSEPPLLPLSSIKDFSPLSVDFQLERFESTQTQGTTTASMRFTHMYKEMIDRHHDIRMSSDTRVCLLGPGMSKGVGANMCPQFAEMLSLFPNAEFLVLDKETAVLQLLQEQVNSIGGLAYHGATHRARFQGSIHNSLRAPNCYLPLLKSMAQSFTKLRSDFAKKKNLRIDQPRMFYGHGSICPTFLNIDPEKVRIVGSDFADYVPDDTDQFDVIVATLSLMYAIEKDSTFEGRKIICSKYIGMLKDRGSLYIDQALYNALFNHERGLYFIRQLERQFNSTLTFDKIPLSDFRHEIQGDLGVVQSIEGHNNIGQATSTSVWVITRTIDRE